MDEYVVGSIADLISNKKCPKNRAKKEKLKRKDQDININNDITTDKVPPVVKCKSKTDNSEKVTTNATKIHKKDISTEVKSEAVPKKKKRAVELASSSGSAGVPKWKKPKMDLKNSDFNPFPGQRDNKEKAREEDKQRTKRKNTKQSNKIPDKQKLIEDFNKNTVFVGNIPISYDKKKLLKIFSTYGEIQSVRVRCVPIAEINMSKKVAAIKKKYNPKRNSAVAYVKYKSEDSTKAALEANGMVIDGHHLRVDMADKNKKRDNSKAVFVGGLPFDTEDDELWEFFEKCGKIESVRVVRDSHTSMGKGFGYVNFDSIASVELALQLDGEKLKKQTINIKRCQKPKNKNRLNSFDKKKSKEITLKLTSKKSKKFKDEKKKLKKEGNKFSVDFQGRKANIKHKKKKKLSKTALRQKKLVKILGTS